MEDSHIGKKAPSAPAAPDPVATASAQGAANKETALWNAVLGNVNQNTPWGSLSFTQNPAANGDQPPSFTSNITLSPEQQALFDSQNRQDQALSGLAEGYLGKLGNLSNTDYSYGGLPALAGGGDLNKVRDEAYNALSSRLEPQYQRDEESLRSRLINQGITQGSDAYKREMDSFNQNKTDTRLQTALQSGSEADRLLNQSLAARQQGITEYDAQRYAPLNEMNAFKSGTQLTSPQFQSFNLGGAAAPNIQDAYKQQYQGQLNQYNAAMGKYNQQQNMVNNLFGAAAAYPW